MDIHEIRKARVGQLIAEKYSGKQVAFADASGISADYVSRLFSDKDGKKNLGEKLARKAELKLGLPPGWFDVRWDEQTVRVANWYQTLSADDRERFASVANLVFNGAAVVLAPPVQEKARLEAVKSEVGESPDQNLVPFVTTDGQDVRPTRSHVGRKVKSPANGPRLKLSKHQEPGRSDKPARTAPKGRSK